MSICHNKNCQDFSSTHADNCSLLSRPGKDVCQDYQTWDARQTDAQVWLQIFTSLIQGRTTQAELMALVADEGLELYKKRFPG